MAAHETDFDRHNNLIAEIKRDIDNICCIYPTIGAAMYDEPRNRLAQRIAGRIQKGELKAVQPVREKKKKRSKAFARID